MSANIFDRVMVTLRQMEEHFARDPSGQLVIRPEVDGLLCTTAIFEMQEALELLEDQSLALRDVMAERLRQIDDFGYDAKHDDGHVDGDLTKAGIAYAMAALARMHQAVGDEDQAGHAYAVVRRMYPFDARFAPEEDRRNALIRAAALMLAEIERIDRAAGAA